MIETVVSVNLPAGGHLKVMKNVLAPSADAGCGKRVCIATGIHGDELEGQYVCYELNRLIQEQPGCLTGTVELYPALNPLGVDSVTRGIPGFDLDMNRIFPGEEEVSPPEYIAHRVMESMKGADLCIDIHASNIFLREIPQVRMTKETEETLLPYARLLNVDYIWISSAATVLESTLSCSLNRMGIPTLVVEMGVGMRITEGFCRQLTEGILALLKSMGIWQGTVITPREPVVSKDRRVEEIYAGKPGIFIPCAMHWSAVGKGALLGRIVDPLEGCVEEEVYAPMEGRLFTLREYPVVSQGSLLARILGGADA